MQLSKKGIVIGDSTLEWKNMEQLDIVVMHNENHSADRFLKVNMAGNEEPIYVPLSSDIKSPDDFVNKLQQYIKDNPGNVEGFNTHHTASF